MDQKPKITTETRQLIILALAVISIAYPAMHIIGGSLGVEVPGDPTALASVAVGALAAMAIDKAAS